MLLPFIAAGLAAGSIYGLAGVGLVLTYRTSGVFNFGFGAIGTVAAYLFYTLHVTHGVAWPVAAAVSVVVVGGVLGVALAQLSPRLARATLGLQIAATVGVLLIVEAATTLVYGTDQRIVPPFLPQHPIHLFGATIAVAQVIIFAVGLVAVALLYLGFQYTRRGREVRAVVDNPELLSLSGTSPAGTRRLAWVVGCLFAALAGVLLVPNLGLSPTAITLLVVQAFGAAAVGRLSSLPFTYVGGLVIGVAAAVLTKYFNQQTLLSGLAASMPFVVLFVVLLVTPRGKGHTRDTVIRAIRPRWSMPGRAQLGLAVPFAILLCFVPQLVGSNLTNFTSALTFLVLFLSLGLLVRLSGQVSLCHATFAAVGACAFAHFTTDYGVPWLLALLCAGLLVVPLGALLALPAIRLSGLYLALATFGFGLLVQAMFYTNKIMFGPLVNGLSVPRPSLSWLAVSSDTGYYYVVLAIVAVVSVAVVALGRSRLGRLLGAMADSPTGLSALGNSIVLTRTLVFCVSTFLAAIAGALYGSLLTSVSGTEFDPLQSLTYLALIVIVVGGAPWYAVFACIGIAIIPAYVTVATINQYLNLVFGVFALLAGTVGVMEPPGWFRRWAERAAARRTVAELAGAGAAGPGAGPGAGAAAPAAARPVAAGEPPWARRTTVTGPLVVRNVTKAFGGLVAVRDVSLEAPPGRITALIGPNGAGKTTLLNVCSGLAQPTAGTVWLGGTDVTTATVDRRARMGLGRTFQQMELFETMSVAENVGLGSEARAAGASAFRQVVAGGPATDATRRATQEALALCELTDLSTKPVSDLSTGQRRLVELARVIAGGFGMLLLDEPSSGLDLAETARFGHTLRQVVDGGDVGIVLVEHDMSLVMGFCDYVYVLDFGSRIFEGTTAEVQASEVVRAAYLGDLETVGDRP
ncbi:MAG TPA: branched-chain amino acid ABC transporter permease/ATP-binding protein [Acidimicrobiales bacterium]|nr:branched-chain amino acid ABC transporter permease/ATP-binding protein [Acidimicrobiales bacterium]